MWHEENCKFFAQAAAAAAESAKSAQGGEAAETAGEQASQQSPSPAAANVTPPPLAEPEADAQATRDSHDMDTVPDTQACGACLKLQTAPSLCCG